MLGSKSECKKVKQIVCYEQKDNNNCFVGNKLLTVESQF